MKRVDFGDMKKYGFHFVTGEACGISMRGLYGFSEEAWSLVLQFFGLHDPKPNRFVTNYHSTMMLPRDFAPLILVYLVICMEEVNEVFFVPEQGTTNERVNMTIYVPDGDPEKDEKYQRMIGFYRDQVSITGRFFRREGTAVDGFRNRHEFTGLIA